MIETQPITGSTSGLPQGALLRPLAKVQGLPEGALLRVLQGKPQKQPQIGATEPQSGRPVLQESPRPEVNQAAATAEHPDVKAQITEAVKGAKGAKLAGARPEKDEDRLEEKIDDEGQSPKTVRDYSGFRISVDTPEAHHQVAQELRKRFEVPDEQDEFDKGSKETGFHGHTLQVRESGSPVSHEVQILPREVAAHADSRHGLYEKAREGDEDASAQLKQANAADWRAFQERTGTATKYKYGNTQANIPAGSPAAKALNKFRNSVPAGDLAGDGKDVGDGGNHVTVRYGIDGDDTSSIEQYLKSQKPFTAKLGKIDVFPPSPNSDGAAVVHAKVEAPDLVRMNDEIQQHGNFTPSDFKDYKPHATIAYVDPKKADSYRGRSDLEGSEFPVNSVMVSDRNGGQKEVQLGGGDAVRQPGAGGILQRAQGRAGEAGSGRGRVESGEQGSLFAGTQPQGGSGQVQGDDRPSPKQKFKQMTQARKGEQPWIGVDLDGTLAHYDGFKGPTVIGKPIPAMVERVKQMLANGENVKIFTARVSEDPSGKSRTAIEEWSKEHLGRVLPITDVKDHNMKQIWDDRAVGVERNTGAIR